MPIFSRIHRRSFITGIAAALGLVAMPPVVRRVLSRVGLGSTTLTAPEPDGAVEGDLLLAHHVCSDPRGQSLAAPSGWLDIDAPTPKWNSRVAWIIRGASAPDLTFAASGSEEHVVVLLLIRGHDQEHPVCATLEESEIAMARPSNPGAGPPTVTGSTTTMRARDD